MSGELTEQASETVKYWWISCGLPTNMVQGREVGWYRTLFEGNRVTSWIMQFKNNERRMFTCLVLMLFVFCSMHFPGSDALTNYILPSIAPHLSTRYSITLQQHVTVAKSNCCNVKVLLKKQDNERRGKQCLLSSYNQKDSMDVVWKTIILDIHISVSENKSYCC